MKKILAVLAVLVIAGCSTVAPPKPYLVRQVPVVPIVPTTLYNCPQVDPAKLPNPETLTNQQISDTFAMLLKYNATCGANMGGIQSYLNRLRIQALEIENQSKSVG